MTSAVSRRSVLRAVGVTAAGTAATFTLSGVSNGAEAPVFAHGVASGDPMPDSVLLWTRVTPSPEAVPGSGKGAAVAADAGFARVVARGHLRTGPERDHTVKVTAGGLRAATGYWYRFTSQGKVSQTGRTRTAPSRDEDVESLRFGVVSCANWAVGHFAPYGYLSGRDDLDAFIHLGDYLYEGSPNPAGDLRPSVPPNELITLADYRQRHAMYKTDEHLRRLHARHPMIATWDDHEVADNAWSGGSPSHHPATEGDWAASRAGPRPGT
ncbi:alkaline phosphatase D family protein [Amycolatopsis keratiniphila]|uniref:alkaline phosphatase D family protein n=1 Tax=Amycolatopsis keratiniphila TaxID=129921 RepID=UPI001E3DE640